MNYNIFLLGTVLILSKGVMAASDQDLKISGFANFSADKSNVETKYFDKIGNTITYTESSIGLNFSKKINDNLSIQTQIFGHDKNDGIIFDWFFATYEINEYSKVKLGKLKFSGNLYSEIVDVGSAHHWNRLPTEIYGHNEAEVAMTIESFKGAALKNTYDLNDEELKLGFEIYTGVSEAAEEGELGFEDMHGIVLIISNDSYNFGLSYLTYSIAEEEHDDHEDESIEAQEDSMVEAKLNLLSAYAKAEWEQFFVLAEISRSSSDDVPKLDTNAWYISTGYRINKFLPHITLAQFDQDTGKSQKSISIGINYNLDINTTLKLQFDNIKVNNDAGIGEVFFEETPGETVYITSLGLNYTF